MKITETLSVKITDIFIDNHVFPSRQRAAIAPECCRGNWYEPEEPEGLEEV